MSELEFIKLGIEDWDEDKKQLLEAVISAIESLNNKVRYDIIGNQDAEIYNNLICTVEIVLDKNWDEIDEILSRKAD